MKKIFFGLQLAAVLLISFLLIPRGVMAEEIPVTTTQTYNAGYFTGFLFEIGNNLFREADGTLHMAIVDNYEVWYLTSSDEGVTWSKTKVPTGHDGDIRMANLVVDHDGTVFIAFTANDYFNYSNPTGVGYGSEFYFDLYCANNSGGSWSVDLLYTHSSNFGAEAMAMVVDGNNDIHLFANYYGWWNQGGTAWEWIRSSAGGSWSGQTEIVKFTDRPLDRGIYSFYRPLIDSNGNITLIMERQGSTLGTDDELFYVSNAGGSWSAPVTIDATIDRSYAGSWGFDAAIDANDHIHLVYYADNAAGSPEIKYSTDFGSPVVIYTGAAEDMIYELKLHSDAAGNLTTFVRRSGQTTALADKPSTGSWSDLYDLPTSAEDGDVFYGFVAQTDVRSGVFTNFAMSYYDYEAIALLSGPYGPYNLFYFTKDTDPVPDIKANGQDGPLLANQGDNLNITVALDPGTHAGEPADWWVVADTPFGYYWYVLGEGWAASATPILTYNGNLFEMGDTTMFNGNALPAGDYIFYFAVDDNQDGLLDATYLDSVSIRIQ